MKIHQLNAETSYVIDPVAPKFSALTAKELLEKYKDSDRRRHRYCFHQNPSVDLHDIIICYDGTTYIPPNKHIGKVESLIVLSGTIDFYLFNDNGQVYDYRRLSTAFSGYPFYVRVPPNTWHGLSVVGTDPCIIKETISGPYDRSSLQWADFAPAESSSNQEGFDWYKNIARECKAKDIKSPPDEIFERVSENVFISSRQLVTVCFKQLNPIIEIAKNNVLKRARLCCHCGSEEKLQEMFIALAKGVDIEESVHLRKDESLTVIDGQGKYLFPNEDGSIREIIGLSHYESDNLPRSNLFTRINRYVPHKIIVESEYLLIHEATSGPFFKSDTDYRLLRADL